MTSARSTRFDRVPPTPTAGVETPSREEIVAWWDRRFGVDPGVFDPYTFWERGRGKLWMTSSDVPDPTAVEALGLFCLRTRAADWKPTTNAVQRLGRYATDRVVTLDAGRARGFVAGEEQRMDRSDPRGYVIVAAEVAGAVEPLGVGQLLDGRLVSTVPKGRRRELDVDAFPGDDGF